MKRKYQLQLHDAKVRIKRLMKNLLFEIGSFFAIIGMIIRYLLHRKCSLCRKEMRFERLKIVYKINDTYCIDCLTFIRQCCSLDEIQRKVLLQLIPEIRNVDEKTKSVVFKVEIDE